MEVSSLPANRIPKLLAPAPICAEPQEKMETVPVLPEGAGTEFFSLSDYVWMLLDNKVTIASVAVIVSLVALLLSVIQPKLYRSEVSLEIQAPNEDFLNLKDVRPTSVPPMYSISAEDSYMKTQTEILQESWLIERALKRLKAEDSLASSQDGITQVLPSVSDEEVKAIRKNLKIEPSYRSRIVRIGYDATDPNVAAKFANSLAQTFIDYGKEVRWNAAQETQELLQPQLQKLKSKLETLEAELQAFSSDSGMLLISNQEDVAEGKLRLLQAELSRAQAERISKESVYKAVSGGEAKAVDNEVIRQYQLTLTDLRRQLADLETLLTPESYKVVRLEAQISELEGAIQDQVAAARKRLAEDYEAALSREAALADAFDQQSRLMSELSARMVNYNALKNETETTRTFYQTMLQRVNEAGIASAVRPSHVRLLGAAQPAQSPRSPSVPLNVVLGMAVGLCLGVGYVTVKEHGMRRLRAPGDVQIYLGMPELGVIPSAKRLNPGMRAFLGETPSELNVERVSWEQKSSGLSESFRGALVSIFSCGRDAQAHGALLVTSPLPMEGKTTVVSNLGITLSQVRRKVLLIDGDLRRPRLHEIFGLANARGLTNLLTEKTSIADLRPEELGRRTAISGLYVLTSGPGHSDVGSLLYSERLGELLRRLRREFDHVLIDAPPCLKFADARMLAKHADGVLLVVRANRTYEKSALTATQYFAGDGVPVIGTILNDWNPTSSPAYGYGEYGQHYAEDNRA
jgi:capsular exopolysaccharide synthesis family protein